MEESRPIQNRNSSPQDPYRTRLIATLVLIPSVPLFLLSVVALGLFYLAPAQFNRVLAYLPGESYIRTALVFAPVTLFALMVLAVLYVLDRPEIGAKDQAVSVGALGPVRMWRSVRIGLLLIVVPLVAALLVSVAAWTLSFVSPDRFDRLIDPLPGESYIRLFVRIAPLLLFGLVLVASIIVFTLRRRILGPSAAFPQGRIPGWGADRADYSRLGVIAILASTVPALLLSFAGLGLYLISPERFDRLLDRIPQEAIVRLGLVFIPITLFALVLLASLYLKKSQSDLRSRIQPEQDRLKKADLADIRATLGVWALIGGLGVSAVMGLGLLGVVLYLVFR